MSNLNISTGINFNSNKLNGELSLSLTNTDLILGSLYKYSNGFPSGIGRKGRLLLYPSLTDKAVDDKEGYIELSGGGSASSYDIIYIFRNRGLVSANSVYVSYTTASSKLVKDNIRSLSNNILDKILKLNVVKFDYKINYGDKNQVELIAEEVYNILPDCVYMPKNYNPETVDISSGEIQDIPIIEYTKIIPYLIKSIQELNERIDEL